MEEFGMMIKGGTGGANTQSGAYYETQMSLKDVLINLYGHENLKELKWHASAYELKVKGEVVTIFKQAGLYKYLQEVGIEYKGILSQELRPDEAMVYNGTLYIFEKKYQNVSGSVDEKLQTCHFKKRQYIKLVQGLGLKVEYTYILNGEWFKRKQYKDVLEYIHEVGCNYFFDRYPLDSIGILGRNEI